MSQNPETAPSTNPMANELDRAAYSYNWLIDPIASALVQVGVPQLIPVDGSSVHVAQLAQQAKVDADLLYKYMRYMSAVGLFKELPNKHFVHNESSKHLLPGHMTFYHLLIYGSTMLKASTAFVTQLRDPSKPAFEHALQMPIWQHFAQNPELEKHFADFMAILSNDSMPGILQNIKLPETGIVADVGGGYGQVLLEFLKANPKLTGIVYEIPTVAQLAEEGLKRSNPPSDSIFSKYTLDVKKRVSVVAGNYNEATQLKKISNADVFFFRWIFHNNNDEDCRKILAGLYQVMKPTAKIIICDCVLKHTPNEWKVPIAFDLIMASEIKGKERTKEEWIQLLCNGDGYQFNISFDDCTIGRSEMDLITVTKMPIH